jgi:hypothetical protein
LSRVAGERCARDALQRAQIVKVGEPTLVTKAVRRLREAGRVGVRIEQLVHQLSIHTDQSDIGLKAMSRYLYVHMLTTLCPAVGRRVLPFARHIAG